MHKVFFYPVNNGDCCQIILENERRILLDFRQYPGAENEETPEFDLADHLNTELKEAGRSSFDVVAFTHADKDHIEGCTEFFELQHAAKYQGEGRIGIDELWVPAAILLESASNDEQSNEFVILRQEARHRLKEGHGIRVFSRPDELVSWMEDQDIGLEERKHLFVDAGQLVDSFTLQSDKVEFFCHSPFIKHVEGGGKEIRNKASLVFNIRFLSGDEMYDYFAVGDSEYEVLEDIVSISNYHQNQDRLKWDLLNVPHHCSYLALSDNKGEKETEPTELVRELLLSGKNDSYIVSSSKPISDVKDSYSEIQPPHIQARKCYENYLSQVGGRKLLVTMEEPNANNPEPLAFEITENGLSLNKRKLTGAAIITSSKPPRAG